MTEMPDRNENELFERVVRIVESARVQVARSVNTAMVHAYWSIGREIIEVEQEGKERAEYGEQVVRRLARRLSERFGKGFSYPSVKRMKQFYLVFPQGSAIPEELGGYRKGSTPLNHSPGSGTEEKGSALSSHSMNLRPALFPPLLSWSHYLVLMRIESPQSRAFYEIEAARDVWSTRELERQVSSLLYERIARSRDKDGVLALAREGLSVCKAADVIKDPMVLEFLELEERSQWLERDLEKAIIDRLELFLLELGKGFCFVARQRRITLEGDHFYVDLVFYNRLLRCFVLVDLKLGKLSHQDLGQMLMYANYFDRYQKVEGEDHTVGIVLCSEKNDAMVNITLPQANDRIHASRYQLFLPTEEQLRDELRAERERLEEELRLAPHEVSRHAASEEPGR